jgi:hypothetical protein
MNKQAIVIFSKYPEKGKVKTRLAHYTGEDKAYAIYVQLLQNTLQEAAKHPADKWLFLSNLPKNPHTLFTEYSFPKMVQQGNNLGEKMANAFRYLFKQGYEQIVLTGGDIHQLDTSILTQAFDALHSVDTVIAPANDGGYYLIGMNKLHESLFSLQKWSHSQVFQETLQRIRQQGLTYEILPERIDIDTLEDLKQSGYVL